MASLAMAGRADEAKLASWWRAELARLWNRAAAVHEARRSQPTMSAAFACTALSEFVANCPPGTTVRLPGRWMAHAGVSAYLGNLAIGDVVVDALDFVVGKPRRD